MHATLKSYYTVLFQPIVHDFRKKNLPEMADKFSFDLRQIIKKKKKIECDA
jgi:hypothetical protein